MRTATRVRLAGWKITSGWTYSVGRTMSGRHWHVASSVPGGTKQCLVSFFLQTVVFRQETLQYTAAFVPLITQTPLPSGRTQGGRSSKVTPSGNQSIFLGTLESFNDWLAVAKSVGVDLVWHHGRDYTDWPCIMQPNCPDTRLFWHHDQLIERTAPQAIFKIRTRANLVFEQKHVQDTRLTTNTSKRVATHHESIVLTSVAKEILAHLPATEQAASQTAFGKIQYRNLSRHVSPLQSSRQSSYRPVIAIFQTLGNVGFSYKSQKYTAQDTRDSRHGTMVTLQHVTLTGTQKKEATLVTLDLRTNKSVAMTFTGHGSLVGALFCEN